MDHNYLHKCDMCQNESAVVVILDKLWKNDFFEYHIGKNCFYDGEELSPMLKQYHVPFYKIMMDNIKQWVRNLMYYESPNIDEYNPRSISFYYRRSTEHHLRLCVISEIKGRWYIVQM